MDKPLAGLKIKTISKEKLSNKTQSGKVKTLTDIKVKQLTLLHTIFQTLLVFCDGKIWSQMGQLSLEEVMKKSLLVFDMIYFPYSEFLSCFVVAKRNKQPKAFCITDVLQNTQNLSTIISLMKKDML